MKALIAAAVIAFAAPLALFSPAPASAQGTCTGVQLTPADNVQSALDSNPPGTTFCFGAGLYHVSNLSPQSGDVLNGGDGSAILGGRNTARYAINGDLASPSGVTVEGFVIRYYHTPLQRGAIQDYNGPNWVIENNRIVHNAAAAVATGDYVQVLNNVLSDNFQEGFSAHGTGGLYQGNTISGNNSALNTCGNDGACSGWEAGGGKAAFTTDLTFDGNTVTGNGCNGLWMDTDNYGTVIENNTITGNCGAGIYEEQSFNFTITGNYVADNGMADTPGGGAQDGYAFDAGIQLRRSGCINGATCLVSQNTVYDNYNGITLVESPSASDGGPGTPRPYGNFYVQNVAVTDNGITATQGALTGAWEDGEGSLVFGNGNTWQGNNYCVSPAAHPDDYTYGWFGWDDGWTDSFSQWNAWGNDTGGSLTVTTAKCEPA